MNLSKIAAIGGCALLSWSATAELQIPEVQPVRVDREARRESAESNARTITNALDAWQVMRLTSQRRKLLESGDPEDPALWERIARIDVRIDKLNGVSEAERAQTTSLQVRAALDQEQLIHSRRIVEAEARRKDAEARLAELKALIAEREYEELSRPIIVSEEK